MASQSQYLEEKPKIEAYILIHYLFVIILGERVEDLFTSVDHNQMTNRVVGFVFTKCWHRICSAYIPQALSKSKNRLKENRSVSSQLFCLKEIESEKPQLTLAQLPCRCT